MTATSRRREARRGARLHAFRSGFYDCLTGWPDAAFELCDAVLCSTAPVSSVPTLSLEPPFRRSHGSLYKALERGGVDADAMRALLVANRPAGWPLVFAVDASSWARCDAETSPERGFYYSASHHSAGQPIVAGWCYQWICQLDWAMDSWTAPLDAARIRPTEDATSVTIAQVRRLVGLLPDQAGTPMFVFDAGYDPAALSHELAGTRAAIVVRIRDDRVFYTEPPPRQAGTSGRSRRHGQRFGCADDPTSWPQPDQQLTAEDPRYGTVQVSAWSGLHPRLARRGHWATHEQAPIVTGTVVRVQVAAPTQTHRPRTENRVAVVRRPGHRGHRPGLARLPAALRHRAHLPLREKHPRLDRPGATHPRAGRPLDLAHPRRLHPTTPGPRPGRRRPAALAATPSTGQTHTGTSPPRFSATTREPRHTRQSTKIQNPRARKAKRHQTTGPNPLPSDQESRLTRLRGFNRKLNRRVESLLDLAGSASNGTCGGNGRILEPENLTNPAVGWAAPTGGSACCSSS